MYVAKTLVYTTTTPHDNVGYVNTATMNENQWYILGLNFENVGATTSMKIKDILAPEKFTTGALVAGSTPETSTQIQIRKADNSTEFYYYYNNIVVFFPEYKVLNGWVKGAETAETEDTFDAGTGFWFKQPTGGGAVALNFAGQVLPADSADIHVKPIWQLAANPYPTALKIKDLVSNDLTPGGTSETATQIQIRKADNSTEIYYYYNNIVVFFPEYKVLNGWVKGAETAETEDTIAPGVGFWIKDPSKTFDIEIKNPTSK